MLVADEYEQSMESWWDDADGENLKYSETSIHHFRRNQWKEMQNAGNNTCRSSKGVRFIETTVNDYGGNDAQGNNGWRFQRIWGKNISECH